MEKVISKDGTPIAVDRFGNGPALILVDGAMCSRGFGPMPPLAKELASQFTVYHYDRRGRGDSGNGCRYDVQREIEDLDAVLQHAGGSAMVFGISSGAALAGEAVRQLRGIRRLALYEAPYVIDGTHEPLPPNFIAETKAFVASGNRSAAVKKFMRYVGTPAIAVFVMSLLPFWKKLTAIAHTLSNDLEIIAPHHNGKPFPAGQVVDGDAAGPGDGGRQEPRLHAELDESVGRRVSERRPPDPRRPDAHGQAGRPGACTDRVLRPCIPTGRGKRIGPSTLNG